MLAVATCFALNTAQPAPRFISGAQQPGPNSIGLEPQLHHDEGPVKGAQPGSEGITPQAGHAAAQQQGPDISRLPPLLQQQWDHTKNTHLGSISIAPNRCIRVWWMCDKCPLGLPHRWQATVNSRGPTRQSGCPYCAGKSICAHNSLAAQAPTVEAQWSSRNIDRPDKYTVASSIKKLWHCEQCGHEWSAAIASRTKQHQGCPECAHIKQQNRQRQPGKSTPFGVRY